MNQTPSNQDRNAAYWKRNLKVVGLLLAVWFIVSYGCSILWADYLDQFRIGKIKLGFWFAQQGSIYVFVILIFVYVSWMNRIEGRDFIEESKEGGDA